MIRAFVLLAFLSGCAVPETRDCLVSYNDTCIQYDFGSSTALNPMGNTRQLIEDDR